MPFKPSKRISLLLVLALGACSTSYRPSRAEKANQVSNIKTQLAMEYMRGQDYRQATASIEDALKSNPKNELAWLVRAEIYQYLKVNDKAQESFRQALSIKPDSAEINNTTAGSCAAGSTALPNLWHISTKPWPTPPTRPLILPT